ncbi:hypothetical protein [Nonomuraea sp. NPDC050786]|uniref:PIN-like domain-containing protein n=1 Tax=Nonomuraea sp. NPDC050786 TaxID=3154840 RepID=UPI0033E4E1F9
MRLLLDENVPKPLHQVLTTFILNHGIVHLLDLDGWSGTRDESLYPRAAADGFDAILTNDGRQMQRPREVAAIATSGIHRIEYSHKHPGLVGIGIAIATVAAGLPGALALLEESMPAADQLAWYRSDCGQSPASHRSGQDAAEVLALAAVIMHTTARRCHVDEAYDRAGKGAAPKAANTRDGDLGKDREQAGRRRRPLSFVLTPSQAGDRPQYGAPC